MELNINININNGELPSQSVDTDVASLLARPVYEWTDPCKVLRELGIEDPDIDYLRDRRGLYDGSTPREDYVLDVLVALRRDLNPSVAGISLIGYYPKATGDYTAEDEDQWAAAWRKLEAYYDEGNPALFDMLRAPRKGLSSPLRRAWKPGLARNLEAVLPRYRLQRKVQLELGIRVSWTAMHPDFQDHDPKAVRDRLNGEHPPISVGLSPGIERVMANALREPRLL